MLFNNLSVIILFLEAHMHGLVSKVVPEDQLDNEVSCVLPYVYFLKFV